MSGRDPSPRRGEEKDGLHLSCGSQMRENKQKTKREIEFWPRLEKSFGRLLKNDTLFSFGSFQKVLYWRGIKTHLLPKQTQYADSRDEAVIMSVCLSYYSPYLFLHSASFFFSNHPSLISQFLVFFPPILLPLPPSLFFFL